MPFPTPEYEHNGPVHMKSSVDELVFNRDLDFSNTPASAVAKRFDPTYGTLAKQRLSQHPHRGVPSFQKEEPAYPRASMPHVLSDRSLLRNRIQIDHQPYHHAFVVGKIGEMPAPELTAPSFGRLRTAPAPPVSEEALARTFLPGARYGPCGSRQPFGQSSGRHRYFVGDVRTAFP